MRQSLSKQAIRARDRFFSALRAMSLRDGTTARSARRIEHQVNEALFLVERYATKHRQTASRSVSDSQRIAAKWLELAAESAEVDADIADLLTLFARHWLLVRVSAQQAPRWVQRAEAMARVVSLRAEQRGQLSDRGGAAYVGDQPMITLVLRGLPRGAQPVDVEVDLADGAVIGRADNCDWVLPGEVVSRHHAQLRYDPATRAFVVKNLSRNGIAVDARELANNQEQELSVGSELCIPKEGHYVMLVQSMFVPISPLGLFRATEVRDDERDEPRPGALIDLATDPEGHVDLSASLDVRERAGDDAPFHRSGVRLVAQNDFPSSGAATDDDNVDSFLERDPRGLVLQLLETYHFLTPAAAEPIRSYIYEQQDAAVVVAAVFADVLTAPPTD